MPAGRTTSRLTIFWLLLAAIPPLTIAAAIANYSVNVPYLDDWSMGKWLAETRTQGLTLRRLLEQYNEGHPVIPRLIQYASARLSGWDLRWPMYISLAIAVLTAWCIWRLARITLGQSERTSAFFALASLYIFSQLQCPNWLWSAQIVNFLPNLGLIACLLISRTALSASMRAILCAGVTVAAEFSFPNGLLLWPVVLCALWTMPAQPPSQRRVIATAWCAICIIAVLVFFAGYHHPSNFPTVADCLSDPLRAAKFFVIFLGMPLAWGVQSLLEPACIAGGLALIAGYLALAAYVVRRRADRELFGAAVPWLLVGLYVLLSAAVASAGRAAAPDLAFNGRYVTFSTWLPISIIFTGALVIAHQNRHFRRSLFIPASIVVAVLIVSQLLIVPPAIAYMRTTRSSRLQAKAGLELVAILGDRQSVLRKVDPYSPGQLDRTLFIDNAGYFHPHVIRSNHVNDFAAASPAQGQARIESSSAIIAAGSAFLSDRPADAVILAADVSDGSSIAIDFTDEISDDGHFEIRCPLSKVPPGTISFSAWVLDSKSATAYRIPSSR